MAIDTGPRPHAPLGTAAAEQVAFSLGGDVAFLLAEQGLLFARGAGPRRPAAYRLLRGIHAALPRAAKWIVRNPVHATGDATATVRGAVHVAARRLRLVEPRDHGRPLPGPLVDMSGLAPPPRRALPSVEPELQSLVDAGAPDAMMLARALVTRMDERGARSAAGRLDRPIAAVLAGASGEILEWATSGGADNVTSHAEVNLLERWDRPLPPGARVFTTLEPCRMCAGLVWDAATDRSQVLVVYGERDPGRAARGSVLEVASAERRRFARDEEEIHRVLQEPCAG